jgi:hypothetical protein
VTISHFTAADQASLDNETDKLSAIAAQTLNANYCFACPAAAVAIYFE